MRITSVILTPQEIEAITGCVLPYMQRRELKRRKWVFEEDAKGRPIIGRTYAEAKLGAPRMAEPKPKTKINLENV